MAPKRNQITNKTKRIEQLLSMAWSTESTARILAITGQILEIDPNNIEALIMRADNTKDTEERIKLLRRGIEALNTPENFAQHENKILYTIALNQRLAYSLLMLGNYDEAYEACDMVIKFSEENYDTEEDENYENMKSLRYRLLIYREEWQKILALAMQDEDHTAGWAYAKLVSAWMLSPEPKQKVCANLFWTALMKGPDIPFYMLGFFEEPDENEDDEIHNDFQFALLYYDVLSISDEFYNWFSRGVILFGLLSNRFEGREREYMIDALDSLGGFNDYEKMKAVLVEGDDMAVIEALAANKCLTD